MLSILSNLREDLSSLDSRARTALVYTALGLTCIFYFRDAEFASVLFSGLGFERFGLWLLFPLNNNLPSLGWWATVLTVFYFVLPAIIIKFVWKADLADFGLKCRTEKGFWRILAVSTVVMLPLVYLMSLTDGFAAKYPFLKIYDGTPYFGQTLLVWELIYFVQFFALEFFFRGFLIHSLKPSLGLYSILVMTVPYCMIHFSKPMPETLSAIAAGIFLGWLSYRSGSIWLGLILHCTVAFSMDIFALDAKGQLFY
jgi:uncharacterized protein